MNLHKIVSRYVATVNPTVMAQLLRSAGSTTAPDGSRAPAYDPPINVRVQVQSLTFQDITQLENINIQGEKRAVYLLGDSDGIVRVEGKGGDMLKFLGKTWLVVQVLEAWDSETPGWSKLAVTLQGDA